MWRRLSDPTSSLIGSCHTIRNRLRFVSADCRSSRRNELLRERRTFAVDTTISRHGHPTLMNCMRESNRLHVWIAEHPLLGFDTGAGQQATAAAKRAAHEAKRVMT